MNITKSNFQPSALFTKLEPAKVKEWKLRFGASDEVSAVQGTAKSNKNQKQNKEKGGFTTWLAFLNDMWLLINQNQVASVLCSKVKSLQSA